jgi:hypothetical protein
MKKPPLRVFSGRDRFHAVRGRSNRRRFKPRIEALEAYMLLTTFVVTTNVDDGACDIPGSLSWEI